MRTSWTVSTPLEEDARYWWRARATDGFSNSAVDVGRVVPRGRRERRAELAAHGEPARRGHRRDAPARARRAERVRSGPGAVDVRLPRRARCRDARRGRVGHRRARDRDLHAMDRPHAARRGRVLLLERARPRPAAGVPLVGAGAVPGRHDEPAAVRRAAPAAGRRRRDRGTHDPAGRWSRRRSRGRSAHLPLRARPRADVRLAGEAGLARDPAGRRRGRVDAAAARSRTTPTRTGARPRATRTPADRGPRGGSSSTWRTRPPARRYRSSPGRVRSSRRRRRRSGSRTRSTSIWTC